MDLKSSQVSFSNTTKKETDSNISLSYFLSQANLSFRATNVIKQNCSNIEDLKNLNIRTLLSFRNCGKKTANEIIDHLKKFFGSNNFGEIFTESSIIVPTKGTFSIPPNKSNTSTLPLFSSVETEKISAEDMHTGFNANVKLKDLVISVRTRNILENLSIETLGQLMFTKGSYLLDQKNFGVKSLKEVKNLVSSICLNSLNKSEKYLCSSETIDFSSYSSMITSFLNDCIENHRNKQIVLQRLCFKSGKVPTLEELGKQFNLTRERVRQLLKRETENLQIKSNITKLDRFKKGLEKVVINSGGIIFLEELPGAVQSIFQWGSPPYILALGQLIHLIFPNFILKNRNDTFEIASKCLNCDIPLKQLLALNFKETCEYHIQVASLTLSKACKKNCLNKVQADSFSSAFIKRIVENSDNQLSIYKHLILPYKNYVLKYGTNLKTIITQILNSADSPMHYREIAETIRNENLKFRRVTDRSINAALKRNGVFGIVNDGIFELNNSLSTLNNSDTNTSRINRRRPKIKRNQFIDSTSKSTPKISIKKTQKTKIKI